MDVPRQYSHGTQRHYRQGSSDSGKVPAAQALFPEYVASEVAEQLGAVRPARSPGHPAAYYEDAGLTDLRLSPDKIDSRIFPGGSPASYPLLPDEGSGF